MEIIVNGLKLNYIDVEEIQGTTPVLILHGWGACIGSVMPIVNAVRKKHRVMALDLPGFGESEKPEKAYDSFDYIRIIYEFLRLKSVNEVILIGHSFGGKLSSIISSQSPELVKKLVLIDSAGIKPKRGIGYYAKVYSFKFKRFAYKKLLKYFVSDKTVEKWLSKSGSTDYNNSSGVMRQILVKVVNEDISHMLHSIKSPTLIVWGEHDTDTPLYMAQIFEKEIQDSGIVMLKGGHFSYLDDYSTFYKVLDVFL